MAKECKNCVHESNFKKHECGTCMVSYYDGEPLGLPSNFKPKPMTNADRIRAMSDEELAVLLADEIPHGDCYGCDLDCIHIERGEFEDCCQRAWYEWLKQPAEKGD